MEFYSRTKRPKTKAMATGAKAEPILGYRYTETGKKELVVKGMKDRYQAAQEALAGVEIKTLIARYTMGDETALNKVQGIYGDFTELPTNYHEAMNMVQNAKEAFEQLPKNIREAFNNNVDEFIGAIGSDKYNEIMGIKKTNELEVEPIKEEVTTE